MNPSDSMDLIIFDCDGVLVDSEVLCHQVLQKMIGEYGVTLTLEETFGHFMGSSTEGCVATLASVIGRPAPDDFLGRFTERAFSAFSDGLVAVPGVAELIAALPWPYCVASNGPHEKMKFTLGRTGLIQHFEGRMFSAQDVQRPKPAPDLFLHAAKACGAEPANCVVIEDSPTGVKAARAAGMTVLGYAAMGQAAKLMAAGAHEVFSAMDALPDLLQARSSAAAFEPLRAIG